MTRRHRRFNWLAVLAWGAAAGAVAAAVSGVATLSWRWVGHTTAATLALFALLMLAISCFREGE